MWTRAELDKARRFKAGLIADRWRAHRLLMATALTAREDSVIYDRVMEKGVTLESIARKYGVTRERIRQIEYNALRKIMDKSPREV